MSRKVRILLLVAPLFIVLDQATKIMVRAWISPGERITVIPKFFNLIYVENKGAAWGLMGENEHRLLIFLVVSVIAFVVIGLYYRTLSDKEGWLAGALALILAGAVGNFIDRVVYHKVTDFLDLYIGWSGALRSFITKHSSTVHYPTFNVADIAICVGVGMFLIYVLFIEPRQAKQAEKDGKDSAKDGKGKKRKAAGSAG